ncbi:MULTISPECIES: FliM/FliN family flagellar motor C-terminal domain-containing protein [unclassified Dyella]|uniref:FliM/FliN family flagellar motor C-terminal domain-containing protein n=1 Tax=unclassified Dyella TaxID=2634549 RepID=UPI003F93D39D
MIDVPRFGWLGESRRIEFHALLVREISEWSRDWWLEHSSAAIDVFPLDAWAPSQESLATWRLGTGTLQLVSLSGEAALGSHLSGHAGDNSSALAARIGNRALADLAQRLARRAHVPLGGMSEGDSPNDACHQLELGAYLATVSLGRFTFLLAIDRAVADLLAPAKSPEKAALASRAQAMNGLVVDLEVCIPLGTASLSHLDNLGVGEVLVGDALLSAPVEIRVVDGQAIAFATLGERDSSRTVTLTHSL